MYCPHCSQFIVDTGDFDYGYSDTSFESDSWSYDQDEMSVEEPMPDAPERSPLKRTRSELSISTDKSDDSRPWKKRRFVVNQGDRMDVDEDIPRGTFTWN